MSKFDEKMTVILEALFTGADEEECARRDAAAPKILADEWLENFLNNPDIGVTKNADGSYDVHGNVDLDDRGLTKLPVKFGKIRGHFFCDFNKLTNLENAPTEVTGAFYCNANYLTSLKGCPHTVNDFHCNGNPLTDGDLRYAPKNVKSDYNCSRCNLTSLYGMPRRLLGDVQCNKNSLTSLVGMPAEILGTFACVENKGKQFTLKDVQRLSNVHGGSLL